LRNAHKYKAAATRYRANTKVMVRRAYASMPNLTKKNAGTISPIHRPYRIALRRSVFQMATLSGETSDLSATFVNHILSHAKRRSAKPQSVSSSSLGSKASDIGWGALIR